MSTHILALLLPLLGGGCPLGEPGTYDVIVVGAGTSGITAAIQAARRPDTTVALIEEGNMIGGQIVAAGVTSIDGGILPPVAISGLYADYRARVHAHYNALGLSANTCYDTSVVNTCSEPRVSRDILQDMLDEPVPDGSMLCLFLGHKVTGVTKDGDRVTGLTTLAAGTPFTWQSHVLIDATEYGDVIPMTGAVYRIGRKLSTDPPDSSGTPNCMDDITYLAVTRQYHLPLPGALVMPPEAEDPARENEFHTLIGLGEWDWCPSFSWRPWHFEWQSRGMPDSSPTPPSPAPPPRTRTGVNFPNDYPGYYYACPPVPGQPPPPVWRGTLSVAFLEDPVFRQQTICAAKLRTLQFLHYMQRLDQLPSYGGAWAIADDEGYDSPNTCPGFEPELLPFERLLPPMPYVRESRRILSVDTLTGAEISRPADNTPALNRMKEALALGDYRPDQHNCRPADYGTEPEEDLPNSTHHNGPFQIPFKTFIPQVIDGFLPAEKNLGYTRVAASASRLQPSTMLVGQAAGAIAALAAEGGIQPRAVRVLDVQQVLLAAGAATSLDTFVDVPRSHERWADAQLVSSYDIMTGFTPESSPGFFTFHVGDSVGRAATAGDLVRAFKMTSTSPPPLTPTFQDVPLDHPQYGAIELMVSQGFDMSGCFLGPNYFCPGFALPRRHTARWMARARWGTSVPSPPMEATFDDVPTNDPDFQAIEALVAAGLMFGCPNVGTPRFCPDTTSTRGEMAQSFAQVLYRHTAVWP
jgi:hypothetical protein